MRWTTSAATSPPSSRDSSNPPASGQPPVTVDTTRAATAADLDRLVASCTKRGEAALGPLLCRANFHAWPQVTVRGSPPLLTLAGLLVGFGTRLGNAGPLPRSRHGLAHVAARADRRLRRGDDRRHAPVPMALWRHGPTRLTRNETGRLVPLSSNLSFVPEHKARSSTASRDDASGWSRLASS